MHFTIECMKKDKNELSDVIHSQKFLNQQFEKLKESIKTLDDALSQNKGNLENQITEIAQELEINIKKTNNNSQYTREECLIVDGIPEPIDSSDRSEDSDAPKAKNNCKESKDAVIALCKELNLVVNPDKISIAHRLKKGKFAKKGPRQIIVKFSNKELCRDVFNLRKSCKEIDQWAFNDRAKKIYINEALTPEKRKLVYDTKQAVKKHLTAMHGIVYVWTHRGDVYIRKGVDGAPKIRVNSSLELQNIVSGYTSLDIPSEFSPVPNMVRWKYVKSPWATNGTYINPRREYSSTRVYNGM